MLEVLERFRHRRFRRDLSAYMDDMLPERARRRLEAHLDSCQACRQELAGLRATVEALGSLPMAEAPRSFTLAAAPVAEVRPRLGARRLEFGLRLATATAAFVLVLVVIGDFAGLPGGGEEEEGAQREFLSAVEETPPAPGVPGVMEAAPAGTPAADETPPATEPVPAGMPTPIETPTPVETPPAEQAPPAVGAIPVETPPAEQAPPAVGAIPVETPAAEETPPTVEATPAETLATLVPGIAETYGYSDLGRPEPTVGAGASEEEEAQEKALEGAEVEEEAGAGAAEAQAVAEEEGGLSREEVVRWLEIGLGAGVGVLVVLWALARLQRNIGNRP